MPKTQGIAGLRRGETQQVRPSERKNSVEMFFKGREKDDAWAMGWEKKKRKNPKSCPTRED